MTSSLVKQVAAKPIECFKQNGSGTIAQSRGAQTFEGSFLVNPNSLNIYTWEIQIDQSELRENYDSICIGIKDICSYCNSGSIHATGIFDTIKTGHMYQYGDVITVQLIPTTKSIAFYKTFRFNKRLVRCINYEHNANTHKNYQLSVKLDGGFTSLHESVSLTIKDFIITPYDESAILSKPQIKLEYFEHIGNNIIASDRKTTITNKQKPGGSSYGAFVIDTAKSSNIYRWTIKINGKGVSLAIGIEQADALSSLNSDITLNPNRVCYVYTHDRKCFDLATRRTSWLPIFNKNTITLELNAQKSSLLSYNLKRSISSRECKIRPGKYRLAVYLKGSKQSGASSVNIKDFEIVGDYTDECATSVAQAVRAELNKSVRIRPKKRKALKTTDQFDRVHQYVICSTNKKTITMDSKRSKKGPYISYGSFIVTDHASPKVYIWNIAIKRIGKSVTIGIETLAHYSNDGEINDVQTGYQYKQGDVVTMELNTKTKTIQFYKTFRSDKYSVHCVKFTQYPTKCQLAVRLASKFTHSYLIPSSVTIKAFQIADCTDLTHPIANAKPQKLEHFEFLGNNTNRKNNKKTIINKVKPCGTSYGHFVIDVAKSNDTYRWVIKVNEKGVSLAIGIEEAYTMSSLDCDICLNKAVTRYLYTYDDNVYDDTNQKSSGMRFRKNNLITLELNASDRTLVCYKHKTSDTSYVCENIKASAYRLAIFLKGSKQSGAASVTLKDFQIIGDDDELMEHKDNDDDLAKPIAPIANELELKTMEDINDEPLIENDANNNDVAVDVDPDDLISPLLQRIQHQNEEIQKLKQNNKSLMDEKHETAALKRTVIALKKETGTLKNQNTTQNNENNMKLQKTKSVLDRAQQQNEALQNEVNTLTNQNATQSNRLTGMEKEINELKWKMNQIREENSRLQDEKKENEMSISDLKKEIQLLKVNAIDVSRFMEWESEEVLNWLLSIEDGLYRKYEQKLRTEIVNSEVCGKDLITMNTGDLQQFGVTKFAHRKTLIGHIKTLTQKKVPKIPMRENYEEEYEGVAAPTAYI